MKKLTSKEEEIMELFWEKGPLFVKELLSFYDEPKPHINTLSTIVRGLEEKGYIGVSRDDFSTRTLKGIISKYFNNSYLNVVSSLVKEEDISIDELKELIRKVEEENKTSKNN